MRRPGSRRGDSNKPNTIAAEPSPAEQRLFANPSSSRSNPLFATKYPRQSIKSPANQSAQHTRRQFNKPGAVSLLTKCNTRLPVESLPPRPDAAPFDPSVSTTPYARSDHVDLARLFFSLSLHTSTAHQNPSQALLWRCFCCRRPALSETRSPSVCSYVADGRG